MSRSVVTACGAYLPTRVMDNHEIGEQVGSSDEWIQTRTGIRQRHLAAEGEITSDLAANAARQAMERANVSAEEIDLIIVASETPDDVMPSTAVTVGNKLGIHGAAAFDLRAACSGFVYGVAMADQSLKGGLAKKALVIGAETFSRVVDWNDRSTCVLFGDGAGAVVMERVDDDADASRAGGVIGSVLHADGAYRDILFADQGISKGKHPGMLQMAGKEVFRHAVQKMSDALLEVLAKHQIALTDIDWLIPHQANRRIVESIANRLDVDMDKIIVTLDRHANTSAASIPLALNVAYEEGKLESGQLIAFQALGAGLTWGACLIRWSPC